jgi:hypothetical protein
MYLFSSLRTGILACVLLYSFVVCAQAQSPPSPLEAELIVPISNPRGQRELSLGRYPRFHVLLRNVSSQPIKLWKDWNSWGYFNLSLEAEDRNGERWVIRRRRPSAWDGDFPDFWVLLAGESLVLEIDMSAGEWEGFPDLYGEQLPATLTAVYENKFDELAGEFGLWIGQISSAPVKVIFQ